MTKLKSLGSKMPDLLNQKITIQVNTIWNVWIKVTLIRIWVFLSVFMILSSSIVSAIAPSAANESNYSFSDSCNLLSVPSLLWVKSKSWWLGTLSFSEDLFWFSMPDFEIGIYAIESKRSSASIWELFKSSSPWESSSCL